MGKKRIDTRKNKQVDLAGFAIKKEGSDPPDVGFDRQDEVAKEKGPEILEVKDLTRYIREKLESDKALNNVWVRGEISNYKLHSSGHMYLTLKDDVSQIRCIIFKGNVKIKFKLMDGLKIIARGNISVYERRGDYQLYISEVQPDGIGALHIAFEQLKKRLKEEGLFDESNKKPIPLLPQKIGVITSPTGAAIRDILNVILRRFPNLNIVIAPVLVQGERAAAEIAGAIELMNTMDFDLIIVSRGGGSLEELWAFNEEIVARAIYASEVPIISGVGHETDFTIADFVADRRAPTPSAAAEIAVQDKRELIRYLNSVESRQYQEMRGVLKSYRKHLEGICSSVIFRQPKNRIDQYRQYIDEITKKLQQNTSHLITSNRKDLDKFSGKLDVLSPLSILSRGYSISLKLPDQKVVKNISDIAISDRLKVLFSDGEADCTVVKTREIERG